MIGCKLCYLLSVVKHDWLSMHSLGKKLAPSEKQKFPVKVTNSRKIPKVRNSLPGTNVVCPPKMLFRPTEARLVGWHSLSFFVSHAYSVVCYTLSKRKTFRCFEKELSSNVCAMSRSRCCELVEVAMWPALFETRLRSCLVHCLMQKSLHSK